MKIFKFLKGSGLLNILGMTAAFAALYILLVQVNYDLGYNKNIKDIERIYIMGTPSWFSEGQYQVNLNRPVQKIICESSPLVESWGVAQIGEMDASLVGVGEDADEKEVSLRCYQMTESALDVFGFEAVQGSFDGMGKEAKAAICEKAAEMMNVGIGDVIWTDGKRLEVGAIFKAQSKNSDLGDVQLIYSYKYETQSIDSYSEWSYHHFVKLRSPEDKEAFEAHAWEIAKKTVRDELGSNPRYGEVTQEELDDYANRSRITLLPMKDMYYSKQIYSPAGRSGNKTTTLTLLAVAILIVVITLINFINFFMAQVPVRMRGVNTKKILGSSRAALIGSFMLESGILVTISFLLAIAVVVLFKSSSYANLISCPLAFGDNIPIVILSFSLAMLMTVASSVYPAFYITSFPPAMAIKGGFGMTQSGKTLRYSLIGLQFVISISFVICALFVKVQHNYMMNYDMGFDRENLFSVTFQIQEDDMRETFNNELLKSPAIKDVAWSGGPLVQPTRMGWGRDLRNEQISFDSYPVSWNFLDFMGIDVVEGRNFSKVDEQCENGVFIFNQVAKKQFGLTLEDKIIGHTSTETDIAGFCEDFRFKPLQYSDQPFCFYVFGKDPWWAMFRLYVRSNEGAAYQDVVDAINSAVLKIYPDFELRWLQIDFFDDELGNQYKKEQDLSTMVDLFTLLAILISLMGVFGLVMFETQYRRKEIGIRRVHGATVGSVIKMFNIRFLKILGICFLVAAPVSYFIVDYYYSTFAYRAPIYWWVFALAFIAVAAIITAVVTTSSYRAATENPVESLKSE